MTAESDELYPSGVKLFDSFNKIFYHQSGAKLYDGFTGECFYANGQKAFDGMWCDVFYENGHKVFDRFWNRFNYYNGCPIGLPKQTFEVSNVAVVISPAGNQIFYKVRVASNSYFTLVQTGGTGTFELFVNDECVVSKRK